MLFKVLKNSWFRHNFITAISLQENTYIATLLQRVGLCHSVPTEDTHAPSVLTHKGISRIPMLKIN